MSKPRPLLIKLRMGTGCTWFARAKSSTPPRQPITASCTSGAERAATRAAAKALSCEESAVRLTVNVEPLWNKPGSYFATKHES